MSSALFANNAGTTLANPATSGATTVTLSSGAGAEFPSPTGGQFFPLTLSDASNAAIFEITYCTARSGDVLTITRGQEGTAALAFNAGDNARLLVTAGSLAALAQFANGQCRLSATSTTQLKLAPLNGNNIVISGVQYQIPAGGVTVSNGGLSASTLYYVYIYNNAGTLTLEISATGHSTDTTAGNIGIQIKTGDNSRSLVGMIFTDASTHFIDGATSRNVINWFNRRGLSLNGNQVDGATTSTTWVQLGTSANCDLCLWADESLTVVLSFVASNNTNGLICQISLGIDGTPNQGSGGQATSRTAGDAFSIVDASASAMGEGHHILTPQVQVAAGGTGTFSGGMAGYFQG